MNTKLVAALIGFSSLNHEQVLRTLVLKLAEIDRLELFQLAASDSPDLVRWKKLPGLYGAGGNNVAVIKYVREQADLGLAEAKWVVDTLTGRDVHPGHESTAGRATLQQIRDAGVTLPQYQSPHKHVCTPLWEPVRFGSHDEDAAA